MALGIKGKTLNWIRALLTDRKEVGVVKGTQSCPAERDQIFHKISALAHFYFCLHKRH